MRAIETSYAGCRFRSRLEARWAVFMDAIDVDWSHEAEGLQLDGVRYLPDFWLPELRVWLEVKGPGGDGSKWRVLHNEVNGAVGHLQDVPLVDLPVPRSHDRAIPQRTFMAGQIPPPDGSDYDRCSMLGPGSPHSGWAWGRCHQCWTIEIGHVAWAVYLGCGHIDQIDTEHPPILKAYEAARSARFEPHR